MGIMPVYPAPINAIPQLRGKIEGGAFPVAESCASELVTLPTHSYVTEDDVTELSKLIARAHPDEGAAEPSMMPVPPTSEG
jgi:dTDP-4-amino-4,6-dideoxygalactose transaminase